MSLRSGSPSSTSSVTRRHWSTATCDAVGRSTTTGARVARRCRAAGLVPDSKIGMYLYNSNEYIETQYAGFKIRGVPVNVNYRYLDDELWYLLDNADAEALVFHSSLGDRVAKVVDRLPKLKLLIEVDDGAPGRSVVGSVDRAVPFEQVIAGHEPTRHSVGARTTSTCSTRVARPGCRRA